MEFDRTFILCKTREHLNWLSQEIDGISLEHFQTVEFQSFEFRECKLVQEILKARVEKHNPIIYTIKLIDKNLLPKLLDSFESFSVENKLKVKNQDRVNVSRYNKTLSEFIYVGSCTSSDFYTRLKNHFGVLGNRVYSLHLSKWDKYLNYKIELQTYKIVKTNKEVANRLLVELIEQQIWDLLQPNFGKRSGLG